MDDNQFFIDCIFNSSRITTSNRSITTINEIKHKKLLS